jgi:hypothetical protein
VFSPGAVRTSEKTRRCYGKRHRRYRLGRAYHLPDIQHDSAGEILTSKAFVAERRQLKKENEHSRLAGVSDLSDRPRTHH